MFARPVTKFSHGGATIAVNGQLKASVGIDSFVGPGFGGKWGAFKAGMTAEINPMAASMQAVVGTNNCAAVSMGSELEVGAGFEAWILDEHIGWNDKLSLFKAAVAYPGAKFEIGSCD